jgi:type IV secretory pathway VirD2 relaxase
VADDDFDVRPGRSRDQGAGNYRKAKSLVGRVQQLGRRSGRARSSLIGRPARGTGRFGRGRQAAIGHRSGRFQRRVIVKARVVRHRGIRFHSAPLARHLAYLSRDGVTRDGADGRMFDASSDVADGEAFAARCEDDRHHFRFIISPEDAAELRDLRIFTRELASDMARDLGTPLDWVAIDHWNTASPHVHMLVRGVAGDGGDLVIDRGYIGTGLRARAEERVTIELGPRSEREIEAALRREVDAERWTGLDRRLQHLRGDDGVVDLRPETSRRTGHDPGVLIGRTQTLERMGLAERIGPATWRISERFEPTLRELGERGDIVKTMHRAMAARDLALAPDRLVLQPAQGISAKDTVVEGRLIERGLHDELTGEAYAIVDATDGRTHYLRFPELERTGDAAPGAIVAHSRWTDRGGRDQASLLARSDLPIERQIAARGATWLDRQLLAPSQDRADAGFGAEVGAALDRRIDWLAGQGLATRQGGRFVFARNLLARLRDDELREASQTISARLGTEARTASPGDAVVGTYSERLSLASGRYALIDDGMGFQLVPWRQDLERHLGAEVAGRLNERGGVDWSFGRKRGPAI